MDIHHINLPGHAFYGGQRTDQGVTLAARERGTRLELILPPPAARVIYLDITLAELRERLANFNPEKT